MKPVGYFTAKKTAAKYCFIADYRDQLLLKTSIFLLLSVSLSPDNPWAEEALQT